MEENCSPFLNPGETATDSTLTMLSLGRSHIPILLAAPTIQEPNGKIINSRFGSYPHSTLLNLPWGSQVKASNVGALNRQRGKKRKLGEDAENTVEEVVEFEAADSGFAHVLYPTPETWTTSLPHRTQVVYTPDYSYILQRICARPGTRLIEAGAGSGSFTHAATRAVFNGYPPSNNPDDVAFGHVFSYEYHEPRHATLKHEIHKHGLSSLVTTTHRDVYSNGFLLHGDIKDQSPEADAIFLDLPAPWLALPHLTRKLPSALHSRRTAYLCSFSPCIEQAQRTVSLLHTLGWVRVGMTAIHHSRLDVRRERVGLEYEGIRSGPASVIVSNAANVEESIGRLKDLEGKAKAFLERRRAAVEKLKKEKIEKHENEDKGAANELDLNLKEQEVDEEIFPSDEEAGVKGGPDSREVRIKTNQAAASKRKIWNEGRIVSRTEGELKTHTSYLVFAILPVEWKDDANITDESVIDSIKL